MKENWTETASQCSHGRFSWKMDGRKRYSSMLLSGRMSVNVKLARRRKEQKSTGSATAQNGTKSDGGFQMLSESWEQKARTSNKEWKRQSGIVEHPLSGSQWNRGDFSMRKVGV